MNHRFLLLAAAGLLCAGLCHAQTGVLDPDARYRTLPPLAGRSVLANQYTVNRPGMQPRKDGEQQAPRRQKYYPVDSDSLRVDAAIDSVNTARSERPVPGTRRRGSRPVLFLVGDSTMRTEVAGNGDNGQWGWGYFIENYFDTDRITVENHALGGESTRSWYKNFLFPMLRAVRPGDWVVLQLGHNDRYNGAEMADGRFRGILPGTGKEFTEVILPGNGTRERVYTYGEYLRIYIDEIRARGGQPLLLSLTSRSSRGEDGRMVPDRNTEVIRTIAGEKGVPFIDFNAAIRRKYDEVFDAAKVGYLFFSDGIHTSTFGAVINAETFVEELRKRPDIALSGYLLPGKQYSSPVRKPGRPVTFLFGDNPAGAKDFAKAVRGALDNRAQAGVSARSYLRDGRWNEIYGALQPGDRVLIRFHRDNKPINRGVSKGELPGNDDEKVVATREADGINEAVYSFGWYLRKYCLDAREKGAVPVILGDGDAESRAWERAAAEQVGVPYADTPRELRKVLAGLR